MAIKGFQLCIKTLEKLGVRTVFGVAGTQNVHLFEALRTSSIHTVGAAHELAAGFMANGYYRSTGEPGVLLTIPGPGFTYALAAIAEARSDSAAVVHIVTAPVERERPRFQLQDLQQKEAGAALAKAFIQITDTGSITTEINRAFQLAVSGEPGPVIVEIAKQLLHAEMETPDAAWHPWRPHFTCAADQVDLVANLFAQSSRVVIHAGQGAQGSADLVRTLAEWRGAPVLISTSGRGCLPETHPLAFPTDCAGARWDKINDLIQGCDLLLTLGVKYSHNSTGAFRLRIEKPRLVHVDSSPATLNANFAASPAVECDCRTFLHAMQAKLPATRPAPSFTNDEISQIRRRLFEGAAVDPVDPIFHTLVPPRPETFFDALREALPAGGIVVTDSGLHQLVTRRYFKALAPRTFITPTDFQSMGFAIPAATAARAAHPDTPVVAILGDAGFAMCGLEILTNLREKLPVVVVIFNDGQAGLIRVKQIQEYGHAHTTDLHNPDFGLFAKSLGIRHIRLAGDPRDAIRGAIASEETVIIEIPLSDPPAIRNARLKHAAVDTIRNIAGGAATDWMLSKLKGGDRK